MQSWKGKKEGPKKSFMGVQRMEMQTVGVDYANERKRC